MMWVIQWLIQGALVATAATAAIRLVPATAPRLRHHLWWIALASILVLPWLAPLLAPHPSRGVVPLAVVRALAVDVAPPPSWLWDLTIAAWTCSVLWAFASVASDLSALQLLKRLSRPVNPGDLPMSTDLHRSLPAVRGARLAQSDEVTGACAVGFLRPRILVSSRLLPHLDPASLDMIVRHELAHLERFDDWLRLLQRCVLAVAGLHPAVRWISRQIDVEREAACDRLVVERVGGEVVYARALTLVAELTTAVRPNIPHLAPGAASSPAGLQARVERLLDQSSTTSRRRGVAFAVSTATLASAVTLAAALPPLVTITTLEPALRVLASLPAGRTLIPELPRLEPRALLPRTGQTQARVPRTAPDTVPAALPDASSEAAVVPTEQVATASPSPEDVDPLDVPTKPLAQFVLPQTSAATERPSGPWNGIGARAARAGTVTGASAASAGTAVGRFFSRGGRSIADRF